METKICSKCKRELPLDNFRWKNKTLGKRHSQCKDCQKSQEHKHYEESKERQYLVKERAKNQKDNNLSFIENLKQQGCSKCGDKRFYVLDFHHINPNEKENTLAHMIKSNSLENLKKEVDKCILLCANCHREFHFLEKEENITLKQYLEE